MRFIHIADMHFDTLFTSLNSKTGLGEKRRLEQREIFRKVIEYIKKENIEFLFIAGDLYEHNYIRETTIKYINDLFSEIPNTKIFITPGNHDPYLKNSYYKNYNWNNNVHIFNSKIETYEFEDVDIYGFGFEDFYFNNSEYKEIKIKNKNKLNILITHGSLDASENLELQYNPMKENYLKQLGFDYIALGHIHKKSEFNKNIIYPGSTISFGFDELGEHGMLDVYLAKNKINNLKINFIKLDDRIFEEKNINISEINTEEELIEKINKLNLEKNKIYKIIFEGTRKFEINNRKIIKLIEQENIIKIKNKTKTEYNLEKILEEKNLRGLFVKEMLERFGADEKLLEKTLEIGLEALNDK